METRCGNKIRVLAYLVLGALLLTNPLVTEAALDSPEMTITTYNIPPDRTINYYEGHLIDFPYSTTTLSIDCATGTINTASHYDKDHCGGFWGPGTAYVGQVLYSDEDHGVKVTVVATDGHTIDGGVWSCGDNNDCSMALWVRYGGFDFLTAGDMYGTGEGHLGNWFSQQSANGINIDVLKLSHHGSTTNGTSSLDYFLAILPEFAVTCGTASCPKRDLYARLEAAGIQKFYYAPSIGTDVVTRTDGRSYTITAGGTTDGPFWTDDVASPTPTPSVTPTPEGFKTPTATPTATPTPSLTPTPEGFKTPTPTPSPTPTPTFTPTPSPTPTPRPAILLFYDGFEYGVLDQHWSLFTTAEGRVRVSTAYPYAGSYSVLLDDSVRKSLYSTAAIVLTADLSSYYGTETEVSLEFYWQEFYDEGDSEDGVFVSDDYGESWNQILSFNFTPLVYTRESISLTEMKKIYGFDFNDHFQVKFQFYDDESITADGYAIDEVKLWAVLPLSSVTPTPEGFRTPTPTPSVTPTPSIIPSPSTTPTPSIAPTPSFTPTPSITPTPSLTPTPSATPGIPAPGWITDFNGDGTSDIAIFRPAPLSGGGSSGLWSIRDISRLYFGSSGDEPVPGDYDGDKTTEVAVFRPALGLWAIRGVTRTYFGSSSDLPYPGDYDGDGTWDCSVYRSSTGLWAIKGVTRTYFGETSDLPAPGYYTGDSSREIGIFRRETGLWAIRGVTRFYFGSLSDAIVPGDYDGDGSWEAGIFRCDSGLWAVRGATRKYYGGYTDIPVPADYDGDFRDSIGIFRDSSGLWAVPGLTRTYYGAPGDIPVTR